MPVTDTLQIKNIQYGLVHVIFKMAAITMYLVKFLSGLPGAGVCTIILRLKFYP